MNYTLITETDMFEFDAKCVIESNPFIIFQIGNSELKFNKNYVVSFFPSDIKLKKTSFSDLQNEKTINSLANWTQNVMDDSLKMLNNGFLGNNNNLDEN